MLTKPSNLKAIIAILVFIALFGSYQIPIASVQKVVQVICLAVCLICMFLIMRDPEEQGKKWLNIILSILLLATLVAYIIAK